MFNTMSRLSISTPISNPGLRAPLSAESDLLPPTPTLVREPIHQITAPVRGSPQQHLDPLTESRSVTSLSPIQRKTSHQHIRNSSKVLAANALHDMLHPVPTFVSAQPESTTTSRSTTPMLLLPRFEFADDSRPQNSWESEDEGAALVAGSIGSGKKVKKLRKSKDAARENTKLRKLKQKEWEEPVPSIPPSFSNLMLPEIQSCRLSITPLIQAAELSSLRFDEEQDEKEKARAESTVPLFRVLNDATYIAASRANSPAFTKAPQQHLATFNRHPHVSTFNPARHAPSPATQSFLSLPSDNLNQARSLRKPVSSPELLEERPTSYNSIEEEPAKRSRRKSFSRMFHKKTQNEDQENRSKYMTDARKRSISVPSSKPAKVAKKKGPEVSMDKQAASSYTVLAPTRPQRSPSSPPVMAHSGHAIDSYFPPTLSQGLVQRNEQQNLTVLPAVTTRRRSASHSPDSLPLSQIPRIQQSNGDRNRITHSSRGPSDQRILRPAKNHEFSYQPDHILPRSASASIAKSRRSKPAHPIVREFDGSISEDPFAEGIPVEESLPRMTDLMHEHIGEAGLEVPLTNSSSLGRSNSVASLVDPMIGTPQRSMPDVPRMPTSAQSSRAQFISPYSTPYGSIRGKRAQESSVSSGEESETYTNESAILDTPEVSVTDHAEYIPSEAFLISGATDAFLSMPSPTSTHSGSDIHRSRTLASDLRKQHSQKTAGW